MSDGKTPGQSGTMLVANGVDGHLPADDFAVWAYRLLLNKEAPDSLPDDIKDNPDNLMRSLLRSQEFRLRYVKLLGQSAPAPYRSWNKEAVAFIHLHKTGGTTLHALLAASFPKKRVCPERFETLHLWSPSELSNYDLFSGHFDCFALHYIPRQRVRTVTMLRDPVERQISHYRFCCSHSPGVFVQNRNAKLANDLGPEEFFEHEAIIRQVWFNNTYLLAFGASYYDSPTFEALAAEAMRVSESENSRGQELIALAVNRAKERIAAFEGIGLTENFSEFRGNDIQNAEAPCSAGRQRTHGDRRTAGQGRQVPARAAGNHDAAVGPSARKAHKI